MEHEGLNITAYHVKHLPIISAFAQHLGLVEEIDKRISGEMEISPGRAVLAMVLDALSGRSPLFRLHEFYKDSDTELLLGEKIEAAKLSDWTLGRVLDRLYDYGTQKILTPIAVRGCAHAGLKDSFFHFDTSSVRVWGDFDPRTDDPFLLTYGYSKDKRPDLKQFIFSLLTVKGGLPVRFSVEDGNSSDKVLSNDVLQMITHFLSEHSFPGMKAFVADSALVTPDNMVHLQSLPFITRLPATYGEHRRIIAEAIDHNAWQEIGTFAAAQESPKRPAAVYKAYEGTVELYKQTYRAIVYHSSSHDARRQKRIDRKITSDRAEVKKRCQELESQQFYCRPDAEQAAAILARGTFHDVETTIVECPVYGRGRPPKDGKRIPKSFRYQVQTQIISKEQELSSLQEEAGCFVLLAHRLDEGSSKLDAAAVLRTYKEQDSIEKGFGFLKDPMILDSLFLKRPHRIEALGLVLVIALFIWRLMQYMMRLSLSQDPTPVEGWKKKPTLKPTSFMMTTKFSSLTIVVINGKRYLNEKLTECQYGYLKHLGLSADIFIDFKGKPPP